MSPDKMEMYVSSLQTGIDIKNHDLQEMEVRTAYARAGFQRKLLH